MFELDIVKGYYFFEQFYLFFFDFRWYFVVLVKVKLLQFLYCNFGFDEDCGFCFNWIEYVCQFV